MQVIVCDDDRDVGTFIVTLLELEGWAPELVESGQACLDLIAGRETPPDALVLDQMMPGLTGIETASRLRELGFSAPIILCSGHLAPGLSADIERLELIACNKIDMEALVRVVRAAVRTSRLSRRRQAENRA